MSRTLTLRDAPAYEPRAQLTRDLARAREVLTDAMIAVAIAERAASGRLPWGLMIESEQRAAMARIDDSLVDAEAHLRSVRRTVDLLRDGA